MSSKPQRGWWTALVTTMAVLATVIAPLTAGQERAAAATVAPVKAANLTEFNPGNIISDDRFFDSGTMSEGAIQSFLEQRVRTCRSGYVCLKDWYDTTRSTTADAMCGAYSGGYRERASAIIYKVARACGINPQVLLVTLQKEQSLVNHDWPSDWRFERAMGQGCPDTSACDTRYYGFFNQVYGAAWQFKRYANPPGTSQYFTWYAPGRTWNLLYAPPVKVNGAWVDVCGSSPVHIVNQATANLYYFTPYQPNRASLAAGYGEGDSCSSYGNRNFYQYFTDWFGSTGISVQGSIRTLWLSHGGSAGWIGGPTSPMYSNGSNGGGWYQRFQNASIYAMAAGPTVAMKYSSGISETWESKGGVNSGLGWPTVAEDCTTSVCVTTFQYASLVWNAKDARIVETFGGLRAHWMAEGGARNPLGAPVEPPRYTADGGGGWVQALQHGAVYQRDGGAAASVRNDSALARRWLAEGGPRSAAGWPLAGEECNASGCALWLEKAALSWRVGAANVVSTPAAIEQAWGNRGGIGGSLGLPLSDARVSANRSAQDFTGGSVFARIGAPTIVLRGDSSLTHRYRSISSETGPLGWPIAEERCLATGCVTDFENGSLVWDARTNAVSMLTSASRAAWQARGGIDGWMGAPLRDAVGGAQSFQNATLYTATGRAPVALRSNSALHHLWSARGGMTGALGYPLADEECVTNGCALWFSSGALSWRAGGDIIDVPYSVEVAWGNSGGIAGDLGMAVSKARTTAGGTMQEFERGYVAVAPGGQTSVLRKNSGIVARWIAAGGPSSALGWPRGAEKCSAEGCSVTFERGMIVWDMRSGIISDVTARVAEAWTSRGGATGWVGNPLRNAVALAGGQSQEFRLATIYDRTGGKTAALRADSLLHSTWLGSFGGVAGSLGWPASDEVCDASTCSVAFERGTLTWDSRTGLVAPS